jgi:hypothetical protein
MSGLAAAPYAVKKNVKDGMERHNGTMESLLAAYGLNLSDPNNHKMTLHTAHLAKIQSSLGCEPIKFEFDFESLSANAIVFSKFLQFAVLVFIFALWCLSLVSRCCVD